MKKDDLSVATTDKKDYNRLTSRTLPHPMHTAGQNLTSQIAASVHSVLVYIECSSVHCGTEDLHIVCVDMDSSLHFEIVSAIIFV